MTIKVLDFKLLCELYRTAHSRKPTQIITYGALIVARDKKNTYGRRTHCCAGEKNKHFWPLLCVARGRRGRGVWSPAHCKLREIASDCKLDCNKFRLQ